MRQCISLELLLSKEFEKNCLRLVLELERPTGLSPGNSDFIVGLLESSFSICKVHTSHKG